MSRMYVVIRTQMLRIRSWSHVCKHVAQPASVRPSGMATSMRIVLATLLSVLLHPPASHATDETIAIPHFLEIGSPD